jgi:1-acyl-sn-glycerol-3-phosphate acyltransferase
MGPLIDFQPPAPATVRRWLTLPRIWHRPQFSGLQHVDPARPTLFVGNHTLYGVLDVPHILAELQRVHGIFPRTLGDRAHFAVPLWRDLLHTLGCVEGTRENCARLMQAGRHLMVFPGGAREVFKRKAEAYRLIWKNRLGFVQLAASSGYRIVPFASLGADDALHIDIDAGDVMRSPIGALLRSTGIADRFLRGGEELPPLVHGLGPTRLPAPARFYISFGRPIATSRYRGRVDDIAAMQELRQKVAAAIESQLAWLRRARDEAQA